MLKVAILGANGFIGSRLVELFHLTEVAEVIPVVRSFSSLARVARFDLDWRVADGLNKDALTTAFAGCDLVVNCLLGDSRVILEAVSPSYQAAKTAGVQRLIYLSSAAVHGQPPATGVNEETPLSTNQPLPYNRARVLCERKLRLLRQSGGPEIVILRPSIVFGPRGRFTSGIASQLLQGTLALLAPGDGICNSLYVDNLVEAIRLCMTAANIDGEAFFLTDEEHVTWSDFYRPIVESLGLELSALPKIPASEISMQGPNIFEQLRQTRTFQGLMPMIPSNIKRAVKGAIFGFHPQTSTPAQGPTIAPEMYLLQQCQYQLPTAKAHKYLAYKPLISFAEGCSRSVAWLEFAGYPVLHDYLRR